MFLLPLKGPQPWYHFWVGVPPGAVLNGVAVIMLGFKRADCCKGTPHDATPSMALHRSGTVMYETT